jgi:predicted TPR repeat methyltransferase
MSHTNSDFRQALLAFHAGELSEAELRCRRALREMPLSPDALNLLARLRSNRGDESEAIRILKSALAVAPQNSRTYAKLVEICYYSGRLQQAIEFCQDWSSAQPDNPEMHHMMAALTGDETPQRCSDAYVRSHFDEFSHSFDTVLLKDLSYRGHEIVAAALNAEAQARTTCLTVLDAGCGTGLCGPLVRKFCRRLVGVDLSPKMLDVARRLGCYDDLVVSELTAFMSGRPNEFDVVIAADVLVYFGALDGVIETVSHTLRDHGLFVSTTEALCDGTSARFRLQASGRYAHAEAYLRQALSDGHMDAVKLNIDSIRSEFRHNVPGYLIVARKCTPNHRTSAE